MAKRGISLAVSVLLTTLLFLSPATSQSDEDKGWTMVFGNAQGNCVSESVGPHNPNLQLKWIFETEERYDYSKGKNLLNPFVANGFCYIQDEACNLYIVNMSDGSFQTIPNNQCFGKLMCMVDGKLVLVRKGDPMNKDKTKRNNIVSCNNAVSREVLWENPVPDGFHVRSNIIHHDNNLYFISTGASAENEIRIYSINYDTGNIAIFGVVQTPHAVESNQLDFFGPIISKDSDNQKLVFAYQKRDIENDVKFVAFQLKTRQSFWTLTEKNTSLLSLSCNNGKIVCIHKNGVSCINSANGIKRWATKETFSTEKDISPPIIFGDKMCIVKNYDGSIKYINLSDGSEVWNAKIEDKSCNTSGSCHAATQDFLFFGDPLHTLAVIDISTGKTAWIQTETASKPIAPDRGSDCVVAQGMLLVRSANGKLYCYNSTGNLVPKTIVIEPEEPSVQVERSIQLSAKVVDSEGNKIEWAKIFWAVKNPKFGKIDQSGTFKANEEIGETEIQATYKNLKATFKIKITRNM
jgi:outer membrane protein assembly factor BamB